MDVANIELCKKLYELSGWGSELAFWWRDGRPVLGDSQNFTYDDLRNFITYAYTVGHLLRKLPPETHIYKTSLGDYYCSNGFVYVNSEAYARSDTPEDAACKLVIELFKQGILTKDSPQ